MKRFLTLFVTPLLGVIVVVLGLPDVLAWLNGKSPLGGLYAAIGIAGCVILTHIITVVSPFKKYEKIEQNKWALVDALAVKFIEDNSFKKFRLAANVMTVNRHLFNRREPHRKYPTKRRYAFFCPMFTFIWSYGGKAIDKRMKLTIYQGSSGMAYRQGDAVIKVVKEDNCDEFNLNPDQKNAVQDLEFIISCPIFAFDKQYNRLSNDTVIGVLNISSNLPISKLLIEKEEDRIALTEKVLEFSKICSLIM